MEDFERIDSEGCADVLKKDGFYRTVVRIEHMKGPQLPIIYWNDIVEVLRQQVTLGEPRDFIRNSPAISDGTRSHTTETPFIQELMRQIRRIEMPSLECMSFWNDIDKSSPRLFAGLPKLYRDVTENTWNSNALVAYPVHSVLLNFAASQRRYLIDNSFNVVGFFPVGTSDNFEEANVE